MDWHNRVRKALPGNTSNRRQDRDIQDELADHLTQREQDLRASGLAEDVVLRTVSDELSEAVWRQRPVRLSVASLLRDARDDLRHAGRLLRRTPGFTVAAVATLALAIGATTALFSVVRGVLLRPLPYPEPEQLVYVWEVSPEGQNRNVVASGNFVDWQQRSTSFAAMGAMTRTIDRALTGSGEPMKIAAVAVTPSVLEVLRVGPLHGRAFAAGDGVPNAPAVAILSHRFWSRRFGAQPSVVGQTVLLDDRRVTIVGILPEGIDFPSANVDLLTNLWFSPEQQTERRSHNYVVIARLKPGVSATAAGDEMAAIVASLAQQHPTFLTGWRAAVVGYHDDAVRDVKPLLWLLQGVVVAVLLIGCANLANLQLARAGRRVREMSLRAAIGAGSGRLFRQVLTESLLLAAAGGVAGTLLGQALLPALLRAAPADIPYLDQVRMDGVVLAMAALVTIFSAVAMGLLPALRVTRTDLRSLLQGARVEGDPHQKPFRDALVVVQVAVAVVLVVSAALMIRTFIHLSRVQPGYDSHGVLTVSIDLPRARYTDMAAQRHFYDELFARLEAQPSIAGAAGSTAVPGAGSGMTFSFAIEGRPAPNATGRETPVALQGITPDYFEVMRIPMLDGRAFTSGDRPDAPPVVIINAALARRHWPNGGAIGSRINFRPGQMPWTEIVGIAGDTRDEGLSTAAPPTIYVPFAQRASSWSWMSWQTLIVRARVPDAAALIPDVRATLWSLDPNLPLLDAATIEDRFAERESRRTLAMQLLLCFGGLALLLSTIGAYAVTSYSVLEQRRQIGIRLALGARPREIAAHVVWRGIALAAAGLALGIAGGLFATKFLASLLFEVPATDPVAFAVTAALLLTVTGAAAWIPARRAMRVDPLTVLRDGA